MGIDNHNNYYDPNIKEARVSQSLGYSNYTHHRIDLIDNRATDKIFSDFKPTHVVHLAAQAGVRYSIENPQAYINSNILAFSNILEACRIYKISHLIYASSSSVYGANTSLPLSTRSSVNHPLSLYAATKKSNELMAHSYSHLYELPTTGLRFFTVYGPWGRPDMALFKFTRAMLAGEAIELFNFGRHRRDFTYIDDVIHCIIRVLDRTPKSNPHWNGNNPDPSTSKSPWCIYNVGSACPVEITDYISALEDALEVKAKVKRLPLQPGDVPDTFAEINAFVDTFHFKPRTTVADGIKRFVTLYRDF